MQDARTFASRAEDGRYAVNAAGLQRMRCIWHHVLYMFKHFSVEYPVLCAIGCGAFAGNVVGVPTAWATALRELLLTGQYQFEGIFVSLVDEAIHETFVDVFRDADLPVPVILTRQHSMLGIAHWLYDLGRRPGILNPSDAVAVRQGKMGMHWARGMIALEQLLAVQTTLLLQHIDVSPKIWQDAGQLLEIPDAPH